MGKRKVTILERAVIAVAEVSFFIESKGLVETAKRFTDDVFIFFEHLSDETVKHRLCSYKNWRVLEYRCVNYKKKYVVAFLDLKNEIIVCEFVPAKMLID